MTAEQHLREYLCHWRHGPSPGLTYYEGKERVFAEDSDEAERRARRQVTQRACFSPGCVTIYRTELVND